MCIEDLKLAGKTVTRKQHHENFGGSTTRLLGYNPRRIAIVFIAGNNIYTIGPNSDLSQAFDIEFLTTDKPLIFLAKDHYGLVTGEWWIQSGVDVGMRYIEVLLDERTAKENGIK